MVVGNGTEHVQRSLAEELILFFSTRAGVMTKSHQKIGVEWRDVIGIHLARGMLVGSEVRGSVLSSSKTFTRFCYKLKDLVNSEWRE